MKKTIVYIAAMLLSIKCLAQLQQEFFPLPVVPEEKTTLSERCNYLVYHYWDRCNLKQSFSSLDRLEKSFEGWVNLMPYATVDTVMLSVDNFLNEVGQAKPENMVQIGDMAQKYIFCDSSEIYSEELYYPFAKFLSEHKKMPKANKSKYASQVKMLESSMVGRRIPNIPIKRADGNKVNFDDIIASRVVLFINDPDCIDCMLAKARLSADFNLNRLIDNNLVKVVSLYPGEVTDEWKKEAARYPQNWEVGACEDTDLYFDLAEMPSIYYLDARHKVLAKNVNTDNLLMLLSEINRQMEQSVQDSMQSAEAENPQDAQ